MTISSLVAALQLTGAQVPPDPPAPPPLAENAHPADEADSIIVTGSSRGTPGDPIQGFNQLSFDTIRAVDSAVTGPMARGYKKTLPSPLRSGLRNLLRNLGEPVVFVNYMLQLKPDKGVETLGRFAINSTIGVAGVVDVAKTRPFRLPYRNNGFGYTLGYYGVSSGPYLYLPLIGPTTARDLIGRVGDIAFLPVVAGGIFKDPIFGLTTTTVRLIDERAESDESLRTLLATERDPYAAMREDYLRTRQSEIDALRGKQEAAPDAFPPPDAR